MPGAHWSFHEYAPGRDDSRAAMSTDERLAIVRRVAPDRWAAVVAALLDGITVVVAAVPPHVRLGDARRLVARVLPLGNGFDELRLEIRFDLVAYLFQGNGLLRPEPIFNLLPLLNPQVTLAAPVPHL